jgi:hypothetical protein
MRINVFFVLVCTLIALEGKTQGDARGSLPGNEQASAAAQSDFTTDRRHCCRRWEKASSWKVKSRLRRLP